MSNGQLAIQVSEHSVRFIKLKNSIVVNERTLEWEPNSSDDEKKKALTDFVEQQSFLRDEFDDIVLSWASKKSTLIPNNIFVETSADAVYELCFGKNNNEGDIDYNRIAELSIINVFDMPIWIKRFFVMKFPRVIMQHEGSHVLRKVMNTSAFYLKASMVLYKDYFLLTLVKHNELEFYSHFDYQTADDVLYHTLFTIQQKELVNEEGMLEIIEGAGCDAQLVDALQHNFGRIQELNKMKIEAPAQFVAEAQQLCV